MAQEVTIKFSGDPKQLKTVIAQMKSEYAGFISSVTQQTKAEAQAAASLQRQRSAALVSQWKADTRAHEAEEKARVRAAEQLQAQRSRSILAAMRAEERERVRIAREAEREIERAREASARNRQAFISGALGGASALIGLSAASEIRNAASAWLDYSSNLENTKIAFTTMMGSAEAAQAHLAQLQQFALKTPFQFEELIAASQRMQALGFNAQQVIPILTDVGNAVAAAGGGSERLDRVVLALAQVQSKGHVATQELNQLAEAGISGWKILEAQLGKTRAQLIKMVEDGEVSSAVFLEAFQKFSQQNFGGLMEQQSKTFTGAMSNIKDALLQTSATAFAPLYQRLSELAQQFGDTATNSQEFKAQLESLGKVAATIPDAFIEIVHIVKDAIGLGFAAAIGTIGSMIHSLFALDHACRAAMLGMQALAQVAAGDVAGGMRTAKLAEDQLTRAHEELASATNAQLSVAREAARVWEDAAGRTTSAALRMAQAGVMINARLGNIPDITQGAKNAGIFQPKSGAEPTGGGGKAAKKAGKTDAERELEQRLKQELAFFNDLSRELADYTNTLLGVDTKTREYAVQQAIANGVLAKASESFKQLNRDAAKTVDETAKQVKLTKELTSFLEKQNAAVKLVIEGEAGHLKQANELIISLEKQGKVLSLQETFWLRFNAAILESNEALKKAIDLENELREAGAVPLAQGGVPKVTEGEVGRLAGAAADTAAGVQPVRQAADQSRSAINDLFQGIDDNLTGDRHAAAMAGLETMVSVFGDLGQAVSTALDAFIKFGSAGTSFRKVVTEILSGVARMAAVKAVFELAEGFAALAMAFFGIPNAGPSASAHFTAAAIYGSIAAVAAVAGRATAGNAFNQATGGGGAAGGSRTSRSGSGTPETVERDRKNQAGAANVVIHLHGDLATDAFNVKVVDAVVGDHRSNGRVRRLTEDGQV